MCIYYASPSVCAVFYECSVMDLKQDTPFFIEKLGAVLQKPCFMYTESEIVDALKHLSSNGNLSSMEYF